MLDNLSKTLENNFHVKSNDRQRCSISKRATIMENFSELHFFSRTHKESTKREIENKKQSFLHSNHLSSIEKRKRFAAFFCNKIIILFHHLGWWYSPWMISYHLSTTDALCCICIGKNTLFSCNSFLLKGQVKFCQGKYVIWHTYLADNFEKKQMDPWYYSLQFVWHWVNINFVFSV